MQQTTPRRGYSTDEAAALFHVKPHTLRAAYCRHGHYAGVIPNKLPNRLLDWPAATVDAKTCGEPITALHAEAPQ